METNNTLTELALQRNSIGDEGAEKFAQAITINNTLTNLNLDRNEIADKGAEKIAEALEINNTLTLLYLSVRLPLKQPIT